MARTTSSAGRLFPRPVAVFSNSICLTSFTIDQEAEAFAASQAAQKRSSRARSRSSLSCSSSSDSVAEQTIDFASAAAGMTIELRNPVFQLTEASSKSHSAKRIWCFTLDDIFTYTPFANDFGPLNFAFVYRFCMLMHQVEAVSRDVSHSW